MLVRIFLAGDVMLGRGIDQIMERPCEPTLHEPWVTDAREYVALAERTNGPLPRRVDAAYVWGDALDVIDHAGVDARIVNLETSITRSDDAWPGKGIHYRMSPEHVAALRRARIDCCTLANNHVLDWGYAGLEDTIDTLERAGIATTGAGRDRASAERPAFIPLPSGGRVVVLGLGSESSGIPREWAATDDRAGVMLLDDTSDATVASIADRVAASRRNGDVVVASIHWGSNWGYEVPEEHRRFAHALVEAGVAIVHGHSSHHPRPFETHQGRLILYGCGDFVNDYEGIGGHGSYRSDLVLGYVATIDADDGRLVDVSLLPFRMARFRLECTDAEANSWLASRLGPMCTGVPVRFESIARP